VLRVPPRDRRAAGSSEPSAAVRERVVAARRRQLERLAGTGVYANAHMTARHLRRLCRLEPAAVTVLDRAYDRFHLSARGADRAVKVARTIADLAGAKDISAEHVQESLNYRMMGGQRG
jgi:magnesium chelatase family protein